jgi:hypothetical protein
MRILSCLILLLTVATSVAALEATPGELADMIGALTAPELAGRGAGSPGERQAAELVASWLAAPLVAGGPGPVRPALPSGWFQAVPLPEPAGFRSVNVVGMIPGHGELAERWIVIGAHLDHLGRVQDDATGIPAAGEYYPGAGDNAAGVAALVHVARTAPSLALLSSGPPARRSVLVCAFGAEEVGLVGSAHLVTHLPVPSAQIDAMVNLDAVGRLGDGPLHVAGLESCDRFPGLLTALESGPAFRAQDAGLLLSDHASFLDRRIPALFFFTGAYPEMNSPADSLAAVDLPGLARVADLTTRLLERLRAEPGPFVFQESSEPGPGADTGGGNRQTWFGSVPDFAGSELAGYLIGAVAEGGPAARGGLLAGDLLVELGGVPVTDLATFTAAMRRHDPGEVVEVTVLRQGRRLRFLVTLGDRSQRTR